MAGWTQSNFGSAQHGLKLVPQRQRPVEHVQLILQQRSQFRQAVAPFHQRGGDQADDEGAGGAHRRHDQNRRHRAGNVMPLEKSGGRRQHGADHECHHDRQKECLRGVEHGDDTDDEECDQREGNDLGTANDRRLLALAVGQWRTARLIGPTFTRPTFIGKDTQLALSPRDGETGWSPKGTLPDSSSL